MKHFNMVSFLLQTSQEEMAGGHIYSVLEGDGIYVPTEVSKCLECAELKKVQDNSIKTFCSLCVREKCGT